jgi:hypothetical protein
MTDDVGMHRIWLLGLCLTIQPANAGTVTCAGKAYKDITHAAIATPGYFVVVSLWVSDEPRAKPKYTLILNSDSMCELEDVPLYGVVGNGQERD